MRADFILQLCDFSGGRALSLSAFPERQTEYSVSVSWIGHGAQAAFLGEVKTKAKARPANKQGIAGWFHLVSQC